MAHPEQQQFIISVKEKYPDNFQNCNVLEIGSLDINGGIRMFFDNCNYVGLDLQAGNCVDVVCRGEDFDGKSDYYDTVVSSECFEHNPKWRETLLNMIRMTRPSGLVMFTCATTGRSEHGTSRTIKADSPFTDDYYQNLTIADFDELNLHGYFDELEFSTNKKTCDLYFYGVKESRG